MEIQQIPLSSVYPSPMNPRKTFDEEALKELADNIEKQGLLQPITVRHYRHPMADTFPNEYPTKYEIVCGERRYRATKLLNEKWSQMDAVAPEGSTFNRFTHISAIVREMTDEEAFDAMITENLQRKDVDPMEEAFAFEQLLKKGDSPEEISVRFGKSIRFVQDRIKLNSLIPELRLAVKDGKMPIVAAMIICKLDDDLQRRYYDSYNDRYTKATADNFVQSIFLTIDRSVWHQNGGPEFAGGCDRKCADCSLNTANHGCLFYEMKTDNSGRCTDRNKFHQKTIAFILSELDKHSDALLREGETMEHGKMAIITDDVTASGEAKEVLNSLKSKINERGYAVNNPRAILKSKCWYDNDDPRIPELLQNGELHPVFTIARYGGVVFDLEYWYKKDQCADEPNENKLPHEVELKVREYKHANQGAEFAIAQKCVKVLKNVPKPTAPLTLHERALSLAIKIHYKSDVLKKLELMESVFPPMRVLVEKILAQPEKIDLIERELIAYEMAHTDGACHAAAPFLDDIGAQWCPDAYDDSKAKAEKAHHSKLAKLEKELKDLGYDTEGNKLDAPKEEAPERLPVSSKNLLAQYAEMKAKHNDAILLFRVGDFYEIFKEDAEVVANTLNLTLVNAVREGEKIKLCGFPHHSLPTYLPKLIRAGKRVAVCEQLKDK